MIVVTFERPDPTPDLVIDGNPRTGSFHTPEDAVGAVTWDLRRTYAPDSGYADGKMLLAAVREASALPLALYAHGADAEALAAAKAVLEAASMQWAYTLTVAVRGVTTSYNAEPALPQWGPIDLGMANQHMARCQLLVPVNP